MSGYCLIGKSLPHTLSPMIHAALGCADYGAVEIADEVALEEFVRGDKDGYNVTIPYKQTIMPMLDVISDDAREIGAVNTVVVKDGVKTGYNTDIDGMRYAMKCAGIDVKDKCVLILGSGGTSHTARILCAKDGAKSVHIVSRSGAINYDNCYDLQDTQIIINTTPVGMMPHAYEKPIDVKRYANLEGVFDCVYNPLETLLVKEAKEVGIKATNGLGMLVEQARVAHNLFDENNPVSEGRTAEILRDITRSQRNVVLIGMAGSGKSTIGKTVAKLIGREFYDSDDEVEREAGMSIADIFAKYGESHFRALESEVIERLCTLQGVVISTGGGSVLSDKNRFYMKSNGVLALVRRDADKLATAGRPLSPNAQAAAQLYESRKPIYNAAADITVDNDGSVQDAAEKILNELA